MVNVEVYKSLVEELEESGCSLLAVSKTKPIEDIKALYDLGQRLFGENKVQEILQKKPPLPKDIEWHLIGSLQTNKVKQIVPHVSLIHSLDSLKLWHEIDKHSVDMDIKTRVLLQIKIAREESKSGFEIDELNDILETGTYLPFKNVLVCGVMGMASFISNEEEIRKEFARLKYHFDYLQDQFFDNKDFSIISMGMSSDYKIAVDEGSNMVRIGSSLFGNRE